MNENNPLPVTQPDSERVEKIAAQLLAQWFAAHCVLPEQSGKMVDSSVCIATSIEFALNLCEGIDRLDLPRSPAQAFMDSAGPIVQQYLDQVRNQQKLDAEALENFRASHPIGRAS